MSVFCERYGRREVDGLDGGGQVGRGGGLEGEEQEISGGSVSDVQGSVVTSS